MSAAKGNPAWFAGLADKIEQGGELNATERALAAHAIRDFARAMPDKPPAPRGRPPSFNHFDAALRFYAATLIQGRSKNSMHKLLAKELDVDPDDIKKMLERSKEGKQAEQIIRAMGFVPGTNSG